MGEGSITLGCLADEWAVADDDLASQPLQRRDNMKGSTTRIIVAAFAATAALSAIGTTGVASAAMVGSRAAATTRTASVQTASARSRPGGTVKPPVATSGVAAAKIEGGSTGDPGSLDEKTCEALGEKAQEYNQKGFNEIANDGDLVAGQADGAAAQAVVDYGMDNGCFFSGLPW
jgi:hypothetical protein